VPADEAGRDQLAEALGRHYASDRIDADELSRRLDVVYGADSLAAAAEALADLPPLAAATQKRRWGRRHGESGKPGPSWLPTKERFVDPTTQRVMRVWVDPARGDRHYVAER
jgi:hypothetical protein